MLTFTRFGRKGRLGNQLFHLAGMMGFSKKYSQEVRLPPWKYAPYFKAMPMVGAPTAPHFPKANEQYFHYVESQWGRLASGNHDISAWLQSEKYWEHCVDDIRDMFTWNSQFQEKILSGAEVNPKGSIAISVRRGDYVNNPNYDLLPVSYYMQALMVHFPDFWDRKILIFSDDIDYCRLHFEGLPNVWFAEGLDDISQLCLMSQCQDFVIANSTFSWWGAYIAELHNPTVKIVRPAYLFAGDLLRRSSSVSHWPDRWIRFDHKEDGHPQKYDFTDVTFTIPLTYDHSDRRQNLELGVCLLQRSFETNIVIGEGITEEFRYMSQWCDYRHFPGMTRFHRTRMLNDMAKEAATPLVANWDADVVVPEVQMVIAVEMLRRNMADGVYPYDGRFARVPRDTWFPRLEKELDPGIMKGELFVGCREGDARSVGGAVLWNKDKFFDGGGENEKMISHAPEDAERWDRYHALGYRIHRVPGQLFHIDHYKGLNSTNRHGFRGSNFKELHNVRAMDKEKLRNYVKAWRCYTPINQDT